MSCLRAMRRTPSPRVAKGSSATYWTTSLMPYAAIVVRRLHLLCSRNGPDHLNCYVLNYWLDLARVNLARVATGTLSYVMPQSSGRNSIAWAGRTASRTVGKRYVNVGEETSFQLP